MQGSPPLRPSDWRASEPPSLAFLPLQHALLFNFTNITANNISSNAAPKSPPLRSSDTFWPSSGGIPSKIVKPTAGAGLFLELFFSHQHITRALTPHSSGSCFRTLHRPARSRDLREALPSTNIREPDPICLSEPSRDCLASWRMLQAWSITSTATANFSMPLWKDVPNYERPSLLSNRNCRASKASHVRLRLISDSTSPGLPHASTYIPFPLQTTALTQSNLREQRSLLDEDLAQDRQLHLLLQIRETGGLLPQNEGPTTTRSRRSGRPRGRESMARMAFPHHRAEASRKITRCRSV